MKHEQCLISLKIIVLRFKKEYVFIQLVEKNKANLRDLIAATDDLEKNRAPFLCYFMVCTLFNSHRSIQIGITVRKRQIRSKSAFFVPCDLKIWQMTFKNKGPPLVSNIKLCASFHCHMWNQTGLTVKRLSWVLTSVTLTFDLLPWPFARTSLLSIVMTLGHFMMIKWWEHNEKGVTDGLTWPLLLTWFNFNPSMDK